MLFASKAGSQQNGGGSCENITASCLETYRSPQIPSKTGDCWGWWAGEGVRTLQPTSFVLDVACVVYVTEASHSQWEWRTGTATHPLWMSEVRERGSSSRSGDREERLSWPYSVQATSVWAPDLLALDVPSKALQATRVCSCHSHSFPYPFPI